MRIVLIAARYLPNRGGLETVVHALAAQLQAAGHAVTIVTNRYPARLPRSEVIDGIAVTRLHFLIPSLSYLRTRRFDLWLAAWIFAPLSLIALYRLLRRARPDVVNVHYLGVPAFFVWLVSGLLRFRLIVSLHGGDVDSEPYKNRFNRWLFTAVTRRADQITACSQVLLNEALTLAPAIAPKAQPIHNGVDVADFINATPYRAARPYLLGVGQLVEHKGFDLLIGAFAQIAADWPDLDLLIAGGGPARDSLLAQIKAAQLTDRVHLPGVVDHQRVADLMCGSLAIVIPSRREPFGIVGLEALASGRPVIASRIAGLVEALDGAEVTWFDSDDLEALVARLSDQLKTFPPDIFDGQHDGQERTYSALDANRANQNKARAQSWQYVTERYLAVYRTTAASAIPEREQV